MSYIDFQPGDYIARRVTMQLDDGPVEAFEYARFQCIALGNPGYIHVFTSGGSRMVGEAGWYRITASECPYKLRF